MAELRDHQSEIIDDLGLAARVVRFVLVAAATCSSASEKQFCVSGEPNLVENLKLGAA